MTSLTSDEQVERLISAIQSKAHVRGFTHTFYRYPARFAPEFVRAAIEAYTEPDDLVIDPFMGGGTTVVEALCAGRRTLGSDINALSAFVARVKTTSLSKRGAARVAAWAERLQGARLGRDVNEDGWREYKRHVPWWLRKTVEHGLRTVDVLRSSDDRRFARCTLLRTAQWALDSRKELPTRARFLEQHAQHTAKMLAGLDEFTTRFRDVSRGARIYQRRRLLVASAADLSHHGRLTRDWRPAKLVITSPPYPGVHVLYHRWQVRGRRETPAPYWITGNLDGQAPSYYTFGPRRSPSPEKYQANLLACFKSIAQLMNRESVLVQLVAYSQPETQLPTYLETLERAGLIEARLRGALYETARVSRRVPNRKWYADALGNIPASQEILLVHQRR